MRLNRFKSKQESWHTQKASRQRITSSNKKEAFSYHCLNYRRHTFPPFSSSSLRDCEQQQQIFLLRWLNTSTHTLTWIFFNKLRDKIQRKTACDPERDLVVAIRCVSSERLKVLQGLIQVAYSFFVSFLSHAGASVTQTHTKERGERAPTITQPSLLDDWPQRGDCYLANTRYLSPNYTQSHTEVKNKSHSGKRGGAYSGKTRGGVKNNTP